jgi:HEAT repeat protein
MSIKNPTQPQSKNASVFAVRRKFLLLESLHVESMHMLANLCPLGEIVIPPVILAPPIQVSPDTTGYSDSIIHQVLPYVPDWPEFMAAYAVKHIRVADLFKGGLNIALIGKPGIGKSTAIAYFIMQLINKDPLIQYLGETLPILIHARDIIETSHKADPLEVLCKIIGDYYPEIKADKIALLLEASFQSGEVILFIDGMDELPRNLIKECYSFITRLNSAAGTKYRLMITAPMDYLDGFTLDNVYPVVMGFWNNNDINNFIDRILHITHISTNQIASDRDEQLLRASLRGWIGQNRNRLTPHEITIQAITILAGVETGKTSFDIMNSFIDMVVPNKSLRNSLEVLAYQTLISENPIINKYELNHYAPELSVNDEIPAVTPGSVNPKKALSLKSRGILLKDTAQGNTIFAHPVYLGFLASNAVIRNGQYQSIIDQPEWASRETALYYLTHLIDISQYLDYHDVDNDSPLHTKLFTYSHWLNECKQTSIWRPQILKRLAQVLNTDNLPVTVRTKALAAICFSNEKGIAPLLRGYLISGYPTIRMLAAFGCGILQDTNSIGRLADLLADPDSSVRTAACMALFAMNREDTLEFTVKILLQADEDLRRAAAELLTLDPFEGHSVLEDGITHQDLLVRRAVVFGLGMVRNDWSHKLLQQLQVTEAQWVVRSAAVQALESVDGIDSSIPHKIPEPHLCPWLIQAASNTGEGISPGIPPTGLLLKLLESGTDEEKNGVLDYLSMTDQESVIVRIYDVMFSQQNQVREAAFYTCWRISLSGVEFPSTKKYGFQ